MEKHRERWGDRSSRSTVNHELIKRVMLAREKLQIGRRYAVVTTDDGRVL